jgi:hypothetical protein
LGTADLQVVGLRIWVHGRQFPDSTDYWDGNWLRVTAYCVYGESRVRVHGSVVHLSEIAGLLHGCETLSESLTGRTGLDCMEQNLKLELVAKKLGRVAVDIQITPEPMRESHRFRDEIDQTYLPGIITACRRLLEKFPLRGTAQRPARGTAPGIAR